MPGVKRADKADLIIHPIRLRLVQAFAAGRQLTARQLAALLPDLPRASLYRHLHLLVQAGILIVAAERPARAIQERIYALAAGAANVGPTDNAATSPDDHLRYFTAFLQLLRGDFLRNLEHTPAPNLPADGVAYYQMPLFVSDEEYQAFIAALKAAVAPVVAQQPTPARRRRLLAIVTMPGIEGSLEGTLAGNREGNQDDPSVSIQS